MVIDGVDFFGDLARGRQPCSNTLVYSIEFDSVDLYYIGDTQYTKEKVFQYFEPVAVVGGEYIIDNLKFVVTNLLQDGVLCIDTLVDYKAFLNAKKTGQREVMEFDNKQKSIAISPNEAERINNFNATHVSIDSKSDGIHEVLKQRGNRYGEFPEHARITQNIKRAMEDSPNWDTLDNYQKETLEMTAHKIGRILNGDPNYDDSWVDICGYNQLVVDELRKQEKKNKCHY